MYPSPVVDVASVEQRDTLVCFCASGMEIDVNDFEQLLRLEHVPQLEV